MMEKQEETCPICGRNEYEWGKVRAQGLVFLPEQAGFLEKTFKGGTQTRARRCTHCGNVQLFFYR